MLTPGRVIAGSLVALVLVLGTGSCVGGRTVRVQTPEKSWRLATPGSETAWVEPWAGRILLACRWAVPACGLGFILGVLWLARRETREEPRPDRATAFPLADERRPEDRPGP